jgi:hypothetical protein
MPVTASQIPIYNLVDLSRSLQFNLRLLRDTESKLADSYFWSIKKRKEYRSLVKVCIFTIGEIVDKIEARIEYDTMKTLSKL